MKDTDKFPETISKEQINALPLSRYEGPIELIDQENKVEAAVNELLQERVLGFDTETRPAFKKGTSYLPSLVQLAGAERVYLFQVEPMGGLEKLVKLFTNPEILKVGVAIRDDIKGLKKLHPFKPAGFIEISDITQKCGIINTGLRPLTAMFLKFRISKKAQVSNWAKRQLTDIQLNYAATDAWTSREIFIKLEALNLCDSRGHPKKL